MGVGRPRTRLSLPACALVACVILAALRDHFNRLRSDMRCSAEQTSCWAAGDFSRLSSWASCRRGGVAFAFHQSLLPPHQRCSRPTLQDLPPSSISDIRTCGRRGVIVEGFVTAMTVATFRAGHCVAATSLTEGAADTLRALEYAGSVQDVPFPIWESTVDSSTMAELVQDGGYGGATLGTTTTDWPGLWRALYAPHIQTLGSLALAKFDVYYDIAPADAGLELRSFVRFETPLGGGWLNAAGSVSVAENELEVPGLGPRPTTEVVFSDFWVDFGESAPRRSSSQSDEPLRQLAALFFFRQLSLFPTLFFDADRGICVFQFPPLGVQIAARRVDASGSKVRLLTA